MASDEDILADLSKLESNIVELLNPKFECDTLSPEDDIYFMRYIALVQLTMAILKKANLDRKWAIVKKRFEGTSIPTAGLYSYLLE